MQLKWPMRWDLFSLFPAYAGVILGVSKARFQAHTFPRIRGGDPKGAAKRLLTIFFSPHTRG